MNGTLRRWVERMRAATLPSSTEDFEFVAEIIASPRNLPSGWGWCDTCNHAYPPESVHARVTS